MTLTRYSLCVLFTIAALGPFLNAQQSAETDPADTLSVPRPIPAQFEAQSQIGRPHSPFAFESLRRLQRGQRLVRPANANRQLDNETVSPEVAVYSFATVDYPAAVYSNVWDTNGTTTVGEFSYSVSMSPLTAFTFKGGIYKTFEVPNSQLSVITGINTTGQMVGYYDDTAGEHGFLDTGGIFTTLDFPSAFATDAFDINDSGVIIGRYYDDNYSMHGFMYKGGEFTSIDFPGSTQTVAAGINSAGDVVGYYYFLRSGGSGGPVGFLMSGGAFTSLYYPGSSKTMAMGINDAGVIVGAYVDFNLGVGYGFIYSGTFGKVDVPGATGALLVRIKNNGHVTGAFADSLNELHGMTGN